MKILATSMNQQNKKSPNFGAFSTTDPRVVKGVEELLKGPVFPLVNVLQEGSPAIDSRGFAAFGKFFDEEQITDCLTQNPNKYLTQDDIRDLKQETYGLKDEVCIRLNEILSKAKDITLKKLEEIMPEVRSARAEASIAESKTRIVLKLEDTVPKGLDDLLNVVAPDTTVGQIMEVLPTLRRTQIEASIAESRAKSKLDL